MGLRVTRLGDCLLWAIFSKLQKWPIFLGYFFTEAVHYGLGNILSPALEAKAASLFHFKISNFAKSEVSQRAYIGIL
jgi:hypothetical protein